MAIRTDVDDHEECSSDAVEQGIPLDVALKVISEALFSPRPAVALPSNISVSDNDELSRIIGALLLVRSVVFAMANGDFSRSISLKGFLGGSLKALQAHLNHLSWQTKMVAQGDFSQRVDFMGEFSESFNDMVVQLEEAHNKLAASEARYRSFFTSTEAVKLIINPDNGKVVDANSAAVEFYGYDLEQMLTMSIYDLSLASRQNTASEIKSAQEKEKKLFFARHRRASGDLRDIEIHTNPILYADAELLMCSIQDITERKKMEDQLQILATTDSLTKLNNRFHFMALSRLYFEAAKRSKAPLGIIMFDVDHFKTVNDTYGHDVGDMVLRTLSEIALKMFRSSDILGRLGGEEFAVVMPETDAYQAMGATERFRTTVASTVINCDKKTLSITISSGIALFGGENTTLEKLLKRADVALYQAKHSGRNRTVLEENASSDP